MLNFQGMAILASLLTTILTAKLAYSTSAKAEHGNTVGPITKAQSFESHLHIRDRMRYDTCGYQDGNSDRALVCPGYLNCNPDDAMNFWVACCDVYSSTGGYDPYACDYFTTCYDSTESKSAATAAQYTMPASPGGDKFVALHCSDTASPYCNFVTFTDNAHIGWHCGATAGVTQEYALSYYATTTDRDVWTESATVASTYETSTMSSVDGESAVAPQPSSSNDQEISEQDDTGSSKRTRIIIGGVLGGAAVIAIGAAIMMLLRYRKKRKETKDNATKPSFNFVGSDISAPLPSIATAATNATPPPQARAATPCVSEVDGDNDYSIKPVGVPGTMYQPYRQHESKASVSTFGQGTILPYHPQFHTSMLSQHLDSKSSFAQLSEMDAMSASSSRYTTNIPPERRQSRFAELDVPHMSMQSGPVPEWDARELP